MPRLVAFMVAAAFAAPAAAESLDFTDRGFGEAAISLMLVDHLRGACASAGQAPLANDLRAWEAANRTPELRRAIATARSQGKGEEVYQQIHGGVAAKLEPTQAQSCALLKSWLASPDSSLATSHPQVFAALGTAAPRPTTASTAAAPTKASAAPRRAAVGAIHGYGLIQTYGLGYGGMVIVKYSPAVLFASGAILTDMSGLADPETDKRANPSHWSQWRRTGGTYEYATQSGKWQKIVGNQVWTSAPVSALSGQFTHVGGGGNLAMGGSTGIFTQTAYEFLPGGRVAREGLASASSEATGADVTTRVTTASRPGRRTGRYAVDGLTMRITYDDGSRETLNFISHPRDANIIWLDGVSYTRKGG